MPLGPLPILSPARPTMASGLPGYPIERPLAAIPPLAIYPTQLAGGWQVSAWLVTAPNVASEFKRYVLGLEALTKLLEDYVQDPEGCFQRELGWPGIQVPPEPKPSEVSLDDLDL